MANEMYSRTRHLSSLVDRVNRMRVPVGQRPISKLSPTWMIVRPSLTALSWPPDCMRNHQHLRMRELKTLPPLLGISAQFWIY